MKHGQAFSLWFFFGLGGEKVLPQAIEDQQLRRGADLVRLLGERPSPVILRQVVEQRLRVLQVAHVEAFGEPGVERCTWGAVFLADSPHCAVCGL